MSDEQPIDESEKRALLFEAMARQIRLNKDAPFGGAFLLIPPGEQVEAIQQLILYTTDPPFFWGAVKTISALADQELAGHGRQQGFSGRR